ncbi:MAG: hypothetical protein PVH25_01135 [Burkholderiales bacterium]|jgi:hypothetical protein
MNLYSAFETGLIVVIGIVAAVQVVRLLMPQLVRTARLYLSRRLGAGAKTGWRRALASRLRQGTAAEGCGTNCGSSCSSCAVAARAHPPLAGEDPRSH